MHVDTVFHSEVDTEIIVLVTRHTTMARTETNSLNRFQATEPGKDIDVMYVLFNDMNGVFADYALSADEMAKWEKIIEVRDAVNGALETARAEKKIGKSLEADVALTVPAEDAFLAEMDAAALADLLIVSQVEVTVGGELAVSVSEAAGTKCPRCWKHSTAADENGLCPRCAAVVAKLTVEA